MSCCLGAAPARQENDDAAIQKLTSQRVQVLQELVDLAREKYEHGVGSLDEVIAAEQSLLNAKLESTTDADERVAIREIRVSLAKDLESQVAIRVEGGIAPRALLLNATANRLQAEIELLREQQQ